MTTSNLRAAGVRVATSLVATFALALASCPRDVEDAAASTAGGGDELSLEDLAPPDADVTLRFSSLSRAQRLLRALVETLDQPGGFFEGGLDRALADRFGFDPFSGRLLSLSGLDGDAPAMVWRRSSGAVWLALPIADPERLEEALRLVGAKEHVHFEARPAGILLARGRGGEVPLLLAGAGRWLRVWLAPDDVEAAAALFAKPPLRGRARPPASGEAAESADLRFRVEGRVFAAAFSELGVGLDDVTSLTTEDSVATRVDFPRKGQVLDEASLGPVVGTARLVDDTAGRALLVEGAMEGTSAIAQRRPTFGCRLEEGAWAAVAFPSGWLPEKTAELLEGQAVLALNPLPDGPREGDEPLSFVSLSVAGDARDEAGARAILQSFESATTMGTLERREVSGAELLWRTPADGAPYRALSAARRGRALLLGSGDPRQMEALLSAPACPPGEGFLRFHVEARGLAAALSLPAEDPAVAATIPAALRRMVARGATGWSSVSGFATPNGGRTAFEVRFGMMSDDRDH